MIDYKERTKRNLYYLNNKDKIRQRTAEIRAWGKAYLKKVKSETPCTDCGVNYPAYVMDFDHLGNKKFNVSDNNGWTSKQRLIDEIAKCEVVCANCHRERTAARKRLAKA